MAIPIINDHRQPQLSKTEKAVSMLQTEIEVLKNWNAGLQRQIAGLLIHLKIPVDKFCTNTRNQEEINKYLQEAQDLENQMVKADQAKQSENGKKVHDLIVN